MKVKINMKTLEDLQVIRENMKSIMNIRNEKACGYQVVMSMGNCGLEAGARTVLLALLDEIDQNHLDQIRVIQTDCMGVCPYEPVFDVIASTGEKTTYVHMTDEKARKVVKEHLVMDQKVAAFTISNIQ